MKFDAIVFEGGGALGCAYVGVVRALTECKRLSGVHKFAGSSVGAVVAALLACGANAAFIERAFQSLDLSAINDRSRFWTVSLVRLLRRGGVAQGRVLERLLAQFLRELTGNPRFTFSQVLNRYGNTLIVTGTSLTRAQTVYFGPHTHGDMPVLEALLISTALPGLFPMREYDGEQFCDGGVLHNYPIQVFDRQPFETGGLLRNPRGRARRKRTIGFKLTTASDRQEQEQTYNHISSGVGAGVAILRMLIDRGQRLHEHRCDWRRTVSIDVGTFSSTDFNLSLSDRQSLVVSGYRATMQTVYEPLYETS